MSEWGDISICWPGIRIMCPSGVNIYLLNRVMCPSGVTYLLVRNQDNVSEWGDISICWSGIRIMCPSGVTYLSVGPESG